MILFDWFFDGLSWLFRKFVAPAFGVDPKELENQPHPEDKDETKKPTAPKPED